VRSCSLSSTRAGGVPLRVVLDNPKTVVLGRDEHGRPPWNQTLAQPAIDYLMTSARGIGAKYFEQRLSMVRDERRAWLDNLVENSHDPLERWTGR